MKGRGKSNKDCQERACNLIAGVLPEHVTEVNHCQYYIIFKFS